MVSRHKSTLVIGVQRTKSFAGVVPEKLLFPFLALETANQRGVQRAQPFAGMYEDSTQIAEYDIKEECRGRSPLPGSGVSPDSPISLSPPQAASQSKHIGGIL
jgi:hypothetical protein